MKKLFIFLVINICLIKVTSAQKEFNNWFFGSESGLSFGTGVPVFRPGKLVSSEGSSSISDKQGNLLFYTNGVTVWDRNGTAMPNGMGLNGDIECTQTALITNHPGNDSMYYIFTVAKEGEPNGLQYSMVNIKLNGGLGDVIPGQKNIPFNLSVTEKLAAIKHRNRNDIWIIAHEYGTDRFVEYLINCSGLIAFPRFISAGPVINTTLNTAGYLKGSPDGKKLAMANFGGSFELFDFNDATGNITNAQTIPNPVNGCGPYGAEFSPDSKLLYFSGAYICNSPITYGIFQYKLDTTDIPASRRDLETGGANVAGALQVGPDNKIYIAYRGESFVGAITNPNIYGPGCTLVKQYVTLPSPAVSLAGLPNFAAAYDKTLLGKDTVICDGTSLTIKLNLPNTTYEWKDGSVKDSLVISASGQYWLKITNTISGCVYRDTVNVTIQASPVVRLGRDTGICQNKFPFLLKDSIPGATYLWQDSSVNASFSVPGAGTYWLKTTLNGCSGRDSIIVNSNPLTVFSLGADTSFCANKPLPLTVNVPASRYLWNTGSTANSIVADSSGLYWCEATNANGCSYRDSIRVTIKPVPVTNIGKDTALCSNKFPLRLAQSISNATYLWQDGSTDSSFSGGSAGVYWMQATVNGCSTRDSVLVTAKAVDVFNLGGDTIICGKQPLSLTVTPAFSRYLWNTGSTSRSISVSSTGLYWCEATNTAGCSYRDTILVTYSAASAVNLGNDTSLCQDKLPLTIGQNISNATYLWQDGSTNAFYSATAAGLYWVQATANGCSARDSITISVGTATAFNLGADTSSCSNQAITLSVNQPFTKYLWNTGNTTRSISVNNTGQYWLEATNNFGCVSRDTVNVSFKSAPVVRLGNDTSVCQDKLPLQIGQNIAGATYLWQDGSTNAFYSVARPGVYWMEAMLNGCPARDSIAVSTSTATAFNLGRDTVMCAAQPLVLGVNGTFARFLWSTGSTARNISVSNAGDFWLEATNSSGCSYRDSIHVDFKSPPSFSLGNDTIICNGSYFLNAGNTGDSYRWQDNSTLPQYLVTRSGSYRVVVTKDGCSKADTVAVILKTRPAPDLGVDRIICTGEELVLNPEVTGTRYLWQDGSKDPTYRVSVDGRYTVEVENECGIGIDEIIITKGSCRLMVPNAFTPGKSSNNTFRLLNAYGLKDFRLQVFNRWGQQLYQGSNSAEGWDGKYKGIDQPSGMYVYIISYLDDTNRKTTYKGVMTLVR